MKLKKRTCNNFCKLSLPPSISRNFMESTEKYVIVVEKNSKHRKKVSPIFFEALGKNFEGCKLCCCT